MFLRKVDSIKSSNPKHKTQPLCVVLLSKKHIKPQDVERVLKSPSSAYSKLKQDLPKNGVVPHLRKLVIKAREFGLEGKYKRVVSAIRFLLLEANDQAEEHARMRFLLTNKVVLKTLPKTVEVERFFNTVSVTKITLPNYFLVALSNSDVDYFQMLASTNNVAASPFDLSIALSANVVSGEEDDDSKLVDIVFVFNGEWETVLHWYGQKTGNTLALWSSLSQLVCSEIQPVTVLSLDDDDMMLEPLPKKRKLTNSSPVQVVPANSSNFSASTTNLTVPSPLSSSSTAPLSSAKTPSMVNSPLVTTPLLTASTFAPTAQPKTATTTASAPSVQPNASASASSSVAATATSAQPNAASASTRPSATTTASAPKAGVIVPGFTFPFGNTCSHRCPYVSFTEPESKKLCDVYAGDVVVAKVEWLYTSSDYALGFAIDSVDKDGEILIRLLWIYTHWDLTQINMRIPSSSKFATNEVFVSNHANWISASLLVRKVKVLTDAKDTRLQNDVPRRDTFGKYVLVRFLALVVQPVPENKKMLVPLTGTFLELFGLDEKGRKDLKWMLKKEFCEMGLKAHFKQELAIVGSLPKKIVIEFQNM